MFSCSHLLIYTCSHVHNDSCDPKHGNESSSIIERSGNGQADRQCGQASGIFALGMHSPESLRDRIGIDHSIRMEIGAEMVKIGKRQ